MTQFCSSDNPKHLPIAEDLAQFVVMHLGQRRVHHQNQTDGDGDVGGADLELVDKALDAGHQRTQPHPDGHRQEDPQRQVAVGC